MPPPERIVFTIVISFYLRLSPGTLSYLLASTRLGLGLSWSIRCRNLSMFCGLPSSLARANICFCVVGSARLGYMIFAICEFLSRSRQLNSRIFVGIASLLIAQHKFPLISAAARIDPVAVVWPMLSQQGLGNNGRRTLDL